MNRQLIIDAILKLNQTVSQESLIQCLKHLSDTNLLSLAISFGIDTDSILSPTGGN